MKKAVCLLSGGLDSVTTLYVARHQGYETSCLIFDYGQRHRKEIRLAQAIARHAQSSATTLKISLPWQGSSLLDKSLRLPEREVMDGREIPSTYVPARNIIFLSFAASFAEAIGARVIFIGVNALDYSGYPDCRPEFLDRYQQMLKAGLKAGQGKGALQIVAPLIALTKSQIIRRGMKLGVPYHLTWSCYKGGQRPCGVCDSCRLRAKGFVEAGLKDPGGA